MYRIILPVIVPVGLVCNTLAFFTVRRPALKSFSTCVYLGALALADNLALATQVRRWQPGAGNPSKNTLADNLRLATQVRKLYLTTLAT